MTEKERQEDWKIPVLWATKWLLIMIGFFLVLGMLFSCSRKVTSVIERTDTVKIYITDTVKIEKENTNNTQHATGKETVKERVVVRTFVVTPLGDTIKTDIKEKETEHTHTFDSLLQVQQQRIDYLKKYSNILYEKIRNNEQKVIEKELSFWDKLRLNAFWVLLGIALIAVTFCIILVKSKKN